MSPSVIILSGLNPALSMAFFIKKMADSAGLPWLVMTFAIGVFVGLILPFLFQSSATKKKQQPRKEESQTVKSIIARIEKQDSIIHRLEQQMAGTRQYSDEDLARLARSYSWGKLEEITGLSASQIRYRIKKFKDKVYEN